MDDLFTFDITFNSTLTVALHDLRRMMHNISDEDFDQLPQFQIQFQLQPGHHAPLPTRQQQRGNPNTDNICVARGDNGGLVCVETSDCVVVMASAPISNNEIVIGAPALDYALLSHSASQLHDKIVHDTGCTLLCVIAWSCSSITNHFMLAATQFRKWRWARVHVSRRAGRAQWKYLRRVFEHNSQMY